MYSGLKDDYEDDPSLLAYLESAKLDLECHYTRYYAHPPTTASPTASSSVSNISTKNQQHSASKFNFTARYKKRNRQTTDELEEYLSLQPEDFDQCDPFQWWLGRRAQFPHLYRLATDVLSIPGTVHHFFVQRFIDTFL